MSSISFDRAAAFYDSTRGLPDGHVDNVMNILMAGLHGRSRCLEIGVGTGRIARPLHQRGAHMVGVDLAPLMLGRLVANAGGTMPFPVAVADATRLPFADSSYDAVLASHVLHLIPDWRAAVDEAMRVLQPGGVLLADFGGGVSVPWRPLLLDVMRKHGIERIRPGANAPQELADYLGERVRMRPLPVYEIPVTRSIASDLLDVEQQIFSWTWPYSAEQIRAAADDLRATANREGLDLEAEAELTYATRWWAFDLNE